MGVLRSPNSSPLPPSPKRGGGKNSFSPPPRSGEGVGGRGLPLLRRRKRRKEGAALAARAAFVILSILRPCIHKDWTVHSRIQRAIEERSPTKNRPGRGDEPGRLMCRCFRGTAAWPNQ